MAIQIQGSSGIIQDIDGSIFKAAKVTNRPFDHGSLGHYRIATTVGILAAQTANGTLFSFRWADPTRVCVITYLSMNQIQTAAATATIMPSYEAVIARAFTVSDSGGTAITLAGNEAKKRSNMGTSLIADIRKSTLAAGLTAGTRTLDANPVAQMFTNSAITTPNPSVYARDFIGRNANTHPVVLAQNEGFIVRGPSVAFGVTGTANLNIEVEWAELASY